MPLCVPHCYPADIGINIVEVARRFNIGDIAAMPLSSALCQRGSGTDGGGIDGEIEASVLSYFPPHRSLLPSGYSLRRPSPSSGRYIPDARRRVLVALNHVLPPSMLRRTTLTSVGTASLEVRTRY